jgi:apolipoprotein N-acyltransferase
MATQPRLVWSLAAGCIYALTFAADPLPSWALSWVQLLVLIFLSHWVISAKSLKRAALIGWTFGFGCFALGLYWLTISMHVYGGMALPLAGTALALFSAYLALYGAGAALLCRWLLRHHQGLAPLTLLWKATVWAACWSGAELLRATVFTGFPWLATAYGQTDGWVAGWSTLGGSLGVTFITTWMSAAIAVTLAAETAQRTSPFTPKRGIALALAIVLGFVGAMLQQTPFTTRYGQPLVVRLVQGNVDQGIKFDSSAYNDAHSLHLELAGHQKNTPQSNAAPTPQLILLPETVIARLSTHVPAKHWQDWVELARRDQASVLLGVVVFDPSTQRYTNSVIAIDARSAAESMSRGIAAGRYDKHHLVPFGEFVPTGFRWFIDLMRIPLGDFHAGSNDQAPLDIDGQRIGINICYEDIFGDELLPSVRSGATLLANFSNLGWFGDSWALRQHWQMSRMRAMETRRPMLRATNTGTTGAIAHTGQIIAQLPALSAGYVDVRIQGRTGLTPYARWGDTPLIALICCILGVAFLLSVRAKTTNHA